ncbi:MAG TPA: hypothetical protein EYQ54_08825 [Myxococcales bacterium]|jgi:hypothetical protein|nr:hypothetical protein [Myxococcales bacterium]
MSDSNAQGWRQLCLKNAKGPSAGEFCSLDLERDVEEVMGCLSKDELKDFDLGEFREFLRADQSWTNPRPRFEEKLRRELWWTMVQGLAPGGRRVPQA